MFSSRGKIFCIFLSFDRGEYSVAGIGVFQHRGVIEYSIASKGCVLRSQTHSYSPAGPGMIQYSLGWVCLNIFSDDKSGLVTFSRDKCRPCSLSESSSIPPVLPSIGKSDYIFSSRQRDAEQYSARVKGGGIFNRIYRACWRFSSRGNLLQQGYGWRNIL